MDAHLDHEPRGRSAEHRLGAFRQIQGLAEAVLGAPVHGKFRLKTERGLGGRACYRCRVKRRRSLPPLPERAARVLARFKSIRWLDDDEKALFASC